MTRAAVMARIEPKSGTAPDESRSPGLASLAPVIRDLAMSFRPSCVLFSAVQTGLFAALSPDGSTVAEAAQAVGMTETSARLLLNGLVSIGLARHGQDARYRPLSALDSAALTEGFLAEVRAHHREAAAWLRTAAFLRGLEDVPVAYRRELLDGRMAERPGIRAMNRQLAQVILDRMGPLASRARHVLDIGGGDGDFCEALLAHNAQARVEILDLASGIGMCRRFATGPDAGRVALRIGDARTLTSGTRYDLVVINELLELFPHAEKRAIVERAVAALAPGGHVAIIKFALDRDGVRPAGAALFSVRMTLKSDGAYLESDDEVAAMLGACGCDAIERLDIGGIKSVMLGRRTGSTEILRERDGMNETQATAGELALWRELISVATSFRLAGVLFAGAELDLFSQIPPEGCSAADVAARTGTSTVGAEVLMNALAAIGIIHKDDDQFAIHGDVRVLLAQGPRCILPEILQFRAENEIWLQLGDILRSPETRPEAARIMESAHLPEYLTSVAMANQPAADRLVEHIAPLLERATDVLDLGGGSGTFSDRILSVAPQLRVTLFDRPEVIEQNGPRFAAQIRAGQIVLQGGDALDFTLANRFDLVLVSDLLHYFSHDEKRRILANAQQVLAPGGTLIISKFRLDDSGASPPAAALISLKVHLQRPEAYLEEDREAAALLRELGLAAVTIERLDDAKSMVSGKAAAA
ncbi:MAG: methyltransferase [Pseudomonadota bacterium]